jgi:hypothetical protein
MKIKNWTNFQHFTKRTPPWIKLYRSLLDQLDINAISDSAFRVLVGCWLLASEDKTHSGILPDIEVIAFRLRKPKQQVEKALQELDAFIIRDDINVISKGCQGDTPETETEREKKTEKEAKKETVVFPSILDCDDFKKVWAGFVEARAHMKSKITVHGQNLALKKLSECTLEEATDCVEMSIMSGWKGVFPERATGKSKGNNEFVSQIPDDREDA